MMYFKHFLHKKVHNSFLEIGTNSFDMNFVWLQILEVHSNTEICTVVTE